MNNINICIVDDHKIVRQGLKELLQKLGGYSTFCEFESGVGFLDALPLETNPDIVILDYSMPVLNGIEVLEKLSGFDGEYRVLLLTRHFDEQIINDAYHFGARGFLHKNCTAHDLKFAIDNIVNIGYNNVSEILKRMKDYHGLAENTVSEKVSLTEREAKFLELVCDENEHTYEQMAKIMEVSVKSIEGYRASLFEKFKVKSKVGLVLYSFKHKMTKPFI